MNEVEWLAATDPRPILTHLRGKVSERKRYLFACACWRCVLVDWQLAPMVGAIDTYEKFAEGLATEAELEDALGDSQSLSGILLNGETSATFARNMAGFGRSVVRPFKTLNPIQIISGALAWAASRVSGDPAEYQAQADLMRHIFGNPFRPLPTADFSTDIVHLAEAQYCGEDFAFALHDALLDAGHVELAEHFRDAAHPKGCWALDHILGKS